MKIKQMMSKLVLNKTSPTDVLLGGIVFDMDGTLCLPQTWMFGQMRKSLGIDKSIDILDYVHSLPNDAQEVAKAKLEAIERTAMLEMKPQPGLSKLLKYLDDNSIRKSICTRNFPIPVDYLVKNFAKDSTFNPVITREFKPPKPHPAGILKIAEEWKTNPSHLLMVGDSIDDMRAGKGAGAVTILLKNDVNVPIWTAPETDYLIDQLDDLISLIEKGIEIKTDKQDTV